MEKAKDEFSERKGVYNCRNKYEERKDGSEYPITN